MGQTFRYVEQVPGDENPIGVKFSHRFDDTIMPWMIAVQVQIREMDCAATGKGRMWLGEDGNVMIGEPPFPMRSQAERPIEWLA
ncbi:MAG: hypothetical protein NTAFB01_06100 [Nitrospira sp.]